MAREGLANDNEHLVGFEKLYVDPSSATLKVLNRLSAAQEKLLEAFLELHLSG